MIEIPEFLEEIVYAGIMVEMHHNNELGMYFDLNSQTKSHMWLYKDKDGEWYIDGRYNFVQQVGTIEDILEIFVNFYKMRDFGNYDWLILAERYGMIRSETKTVTTYT